MIWESTASMTLIDIVILGITIAALVFLYTHRIALQHMQAFWGASILVMGLSLVGLFYLTDLLAMFVIPALASPDLAMEFMTNLHLNWSWLVNVVGVSSIFSGFILITKKLFQLITQLTQSEAKYQEMYDRSPDMLVSVEADTGRIRSCNHTLAVATGYTKEEILGRPIFDLYHPESLEAAKKTFHQFTQTGKVHNAELQLARKDGTAIDVMLNVNAIRDEQGRIVHSQSSWRDISDRKQFEDALRKSEARLREAQRIGKLGNWDWDIRMGTLWWSEEIYHIFGLNPQIFGATYEAFVATVHPADREYVTQSVNRALYEQAPYDLDHRIVLPDGQEKIVHEQGEVIFDESGEPLRMIGTVQDITKQKKAELAFKESEERFHLAVEGSTDGLWDWPDVNQDTVWWSPRLYEQLGLENNEIEPSFSKFRDILHPEDKDRTVQAVQAHLQRQVPYDIEFRLPRKTGEYNWFRARGQALWDEHGHPIRMSGSLQDVTEQKMTEKQLAKNAERLQQLTNMMNKITEEERKRLARELHDEFGQLLTGIKFDITRIGTRLSADIDSEIRQDLQRRVTSISQLIDSAIQSVRKMACFLRPTMLDDLGFVPALEWLVRDFQERTHIPTQLQIDPNVVDIELEPNSSITLFRVAQECLTNTLRHAQASHVTVSYRQDQDRLVLQVTDNGKGMTEEEMGRPDSLGIRGMRERVHILQGEFHIQGSPGQGTQVTVRIPRLASVKSAQEPLP